MDEKETILQELAFTVLSDISHMSEYHIKCKIVELAKRAELICGMEIKTRVNDSDVNEYWDLKE